jgi:CRISPR-associated protein Cst1
MTEVLPLYSYTGNAFVDAGIAAMLVWSERTRPEELSLEDVSDLRSALQSLYSTPAWAKAMFSVFVNYPLNNPSYKGEPKKREALQRFLDSLVAGITPLENQGDCIACGRRTTCEVKNRQHVPLTGSGGMRNFFSYAAEGADYCDTCAFAIQCAPLTFYACGKLLRLQSNSHKVLRYWARRAVEQIHRQTASGEYTGCFNEGYANPRNALFHITQDLILSYEERWVEENATIRLYHFTNYIQGPELDIYDLPAPVFRFLAQVRQHPRFRDWRQIIRRGYRSANQVRRRASREITEEQYKNYKNDVYERLLAHQSIVGYFLDTTRKRAYGDWDLLSIYLREVLQMEPARISAIKRVADEVSVLIRTPPNGERRLGQLERAGNYASFRNVLLRLIRDRLSLGASAPLFTFDDYVDHLFPDGALGWKETQDLLLFRLYEQLHAWLLEQGVVLAEEEAEETIAE